MVSSIFGKIGWQLTSNLEHVRSSKNFERWLSVLLCVKEWLQIEESLNSESH